MLRHGFDTLGVGIRPAFADPQWTGFVCCCHGRRHPPALMRYWPTYSVDEGRGTGKAILSASITDTAFIPRPEASVFARNPLVRRPGFGCSGVERQWTHKSHSAYMAIAPATHIYFSQQVWGISPGAHQCNARGYAHCRSLWLYHAPQAQPCLPDEEICIGSMLAGDLFCGAHPNLSVLPRIIQLPCTTAESGARIYFTSRARGLSRFTLIFLRCGAVQASGIKALAISRIIIGLSKGHVLDTNIVDLLPNSAFVL